MNTRQRLDVFTRSYIRAAVASLAGDGVVFRLTDLSPETFDRMRDDCEAFQAEAAEPLDAVEELVCEGLVTLTIDGDEVDVDVKAGHALWASRNAAEGGFLAGDWPDPFADRLHDLAEGMGPYRIEFGEDVIQGA